MATPKMTINLRLTPRASPGWRTPTLRSPVRTVREEFQQCLSLKKVIGTTSTSSNGFDSLESTKTIAYIAGAVVVTVTFDNDLNASQRSFRAKPSINPSNPFNASASDSPSPAVGFSARERYPASARGPTASSPVALSFANDASDSPLGRNTAKKERTKATTCVALSPDGKFVAAGESGYKPRVLLFSLAPGSYEGPVAALSEHAFGVKCLAFSPDSQYLASLGDINDGFLYVWHINARTGLASLHANNKCTSKIRGIAWMGNSLITVGTRHIKVWRLDNGEQSSPNKRVTQSDFSFATPSKALTGRNCLLGPLLDRTFTVVVAVARQQAIVCSEQGEICVLDDTDATPTLRKVAETGFPVTSATLHLAESVIIGGTKGEMVQLNLQRLLAAVPGDLVAGEALLQDEAHPAVATTALGTLGTHLVCLDSAKAVHMLKTSEDTVGAKRLKEAQLVAHATPCMGILPYQCALLPEAALTTYSSDGAIIVWTEAGDCVKQLRLPLAAAAEYEADIPNELRSLAVMSDGLFLITGDRYGSMSVLDVVKNDVVFKTKAHASEITNISVYKYEAMTIIASAARDRTIQIFKPDEAGALELVQTLEEHLAAVTGLQFSHDGSRLVSCSADRSIIIRDAMTGNIGGQKSIAFGINRTIGLKNSPLSMALSTTRQKNSLFVSTNDKMVSQYSLETGQSWSNFKVTDEDDGDAVNLNMLVELETGAAGTILAGVSSMDKSVRLYDCDMGQLIDREYGHTGGLAGITVVDSEAGKSLATVATDRTVFLWSTLSERRSPKDSPGELPDVSQGTPQANAFFANKPPLRRVLSSSELLSFQRPPGVESAFSTSPSTPRERSRSPRRRMSKLSAIETPKLEPTPPTSFRSRRLQSATDPTDADASKSVSASPLSPKKPRETKSQTMPRSLRRQSSQPAMSTAHRNSISSMSTGLPSPKEVKEPPTLRAPTDQICRSLHLFRKRLAASNDPLPHDSAKELERELSLTAKMLAEKTPAKSEIIMERLLDRYSEKLVDMLDQRVEERVKELVGAKESSKTGDTSETEVGAAS